MPRASPWRSEHDWGWWGRPNQQAPRGDWRTWLLLAGRGFGKTRSGAECIREQVIHHRPPQPAPPRKPPAAAASTRRLIGVSNFRLAQIEECARLRRIDVVQYAWNMFDRRMQAEIYPYCASNRVGVMAYGSLAYGMLSGTFNAGMQFDESDWRSRGGMLGSLNLFRSLFGPEHFPDNLAAVEELKTLARKYDKSLPQFALRWTLSNPVISTGLVGFRAPAEVTENLGALEWAISPADMAEVDAILARHGCITAPAGWLED